MPRSQFISTGSNTTVKSGAGQVYGVIVGGVNGGSTFVVDSVSIGVTPNYPNQVSNSSNLAVIANLAAGNPQHYPMYGATFNRGLTVAATSNTPVTVFYD